MNLELFSPDCKFRFNCHKCDGQAWDDINDNITDCTCECHQDGAEP